MDFYLDFGKEETHGNRINSRYSNINSKEKTPPSLSSLGGILQNSIMTSISTVVMIGGFVMLFSVIISILENIGVFKITSFILEPLFNILNIPSSFGAGILSGIVELTNGVAFVSKIISPNIYINVLICAFLLGFGGISILLQVLSITSTSDISIKPYILGKLLQGIFAFIYTYLLIKYFPNLIYL